MSVRPWPLVTFLFACQAQAQPNAMADEILITQTADLEAAVGKRVTLRGTVENSRIAMLHGVDVLSESPDLRGHAAVASGVLEREVVTRTALDRELAERGQFAHRGPGTYYRLVDPKTRQLVQVQASTLRAGMTRDPGAAFVRGPSLTPATRLVGWLDKQQRGGEPRLVRLPVVMQAEAGFSVRRARIGPAPDAVEIYANDAALGIGLTDRARQQCNGKTSCAFWVEGYWRGKRSGAYQFDVVKVHAPIGADAIAEASYSEAESDSGN